MSTLVTPVSPGTEPTASQPVQVPTASTPSKISLGKVLAWAVMVLIILVTLFPFYWMLRTAFSTNTALAANATSLLPAELSLGGFKRVFGLQSTEEALAQGGSGASVNFWLFLLNSVITATTIAVCQTFFSATAAYAFARLRWRGRNVVFGFFIAGLMVPALFTLLPNFALIKQLGLIDTLLGVTLPSLFMTPFAIFFLRQFFMNIPTEVEEAALIDGASKVKIFFRVILPMASSSVITLGILTYISAWNDYFWPLMVSYTDKSRVLTVALSVFRSQTPQSGTDWAGLMAATLIAALPMLLLFMVFAKRIVNSIGFTGLK